MRFSFESGSMTCEKSIAFKDISVFCSFPSYCSLDTKVTLPTVGDGTLEERAEVRSGPPSQTSTITKIDPEANRRVKLSSVTNPNPNVYPNPTKMYYLPVCHFCDSGPLI